MSKQGKGGAPGQPGQNGADGAVVLVFERPKRLTIGWRDLDMHAYVRLDGCTIKGFMGDTEPEARAAAEKYAAELLEHFRSGGT